MKKIIFTILAGILFISPITTLAAPDAETPTLAPKTIDVYIFTQQGCIHCATVKTFLDELKQKDYPGLVVHEFDLRTNPKYFKKYLEFGVAYNNIDPNGSVPVTYVGEKFVRGAALTDIRGIIEICNIKECKNPQTLVDEYLKANPNVAAQTSESSNKFAIGIIFIVIAVVAGIVIFINKK
jgi:glutaredoxin